VGALIHREEAAVARKRESTRAVKEGGRSAPAPAEDARIPVVQEELAVGTRPIDLGEVRVRKIVRSRDEVVDPPLLQERVRVERVPMNRPVDGPIPAREEDGAIVLSVVEEVIEVRKSYILREEVRIRRERAEVHRPRTVNLKREEVVVERTGAAPREAPPGRSGQGRGKERGRRP
jgi:uncharacterized protein (TIGR02271 family)